VSHDRPAKVLITGGIAGVESYAEALREGFTTLGIGCEVIAPSQIWSRWRELRDPRVLKILSTSAAFAVPFAKRAMCIAHGLVSARYQGWRRSLPMLFTFKLANAFGEAQLVSISDYVTAHISYLYKLDVDATVRNPVKSIFLEPYTHDEHERNYVTFVGRLIPVKNPAKLVPAICDIVNETPGLRGCIIGDGPEREECEALAKGNDRIEFLGERDHSFIRERLRHSKVFVSGKVQEGFGIVYLEALSQGCSVAMPASGGGLEIALDHIGCGVHLMPINLNRAGVLSALRQALQSRPNPVDLSSYTAGAVASAYLEADARRGNKREAF